MIINPKTSTIVLTIIAIVLFDNFGMLPTAQVIAQRGGPSDDQRNTALDNSERRRGSKLSKEVAKLLRRVRRSRELNVIVQTDDTNAIELHELFRRTGAHMKDRLDKLGMVHLVLPPESVPALAESNSVRFISANQEVRAFGHVTATTGADEVRYQTPSNILDGSGIGIAIVDSGIDLDHRSFLNRNGDSRIVHSRDFTGENRVDDPYGHGTHVAATAAGNGRIANGSRV